MKQPLINVLVVIIIAPLGKSLGEIRLLVSSQIMESPFSSTFIMLFIKLLDSCLSIRKRGMLKLVEADTWRIAVLCRPLPDLCQFIALSFVVAGALFWTF